MRNDKLYNWRREALQSCVVDQKSYSEKLGENDWSQYGCLRLSSFASPEIVESNQACFYSLYSIVMDLLLNPNLGSLAYWEQAERTS